MREFVARQAKRAALRYRIAFTRPNRFVVITPGRAGSNYLMSLFDSHPRITHCGEIFGPTHLADPNKQKLFQQVGMLGYFIESFKRKGFEKATGAKFLYSYFRDEYIQRHSVEELHDVYQFLIESKDIRVIHLYRENPLSVLISFEVAAKTGKFVSLKSDNDHEVFLTLEPEFVNRRIREILREQEWVRQTFRSHPFIEISYEQLVDSKEDSQARIMKFLGVDYPKLKARTLKQNRRKMQEILLNYSELKQYFAGTEIENYLDG
jgi:LPS sulfotransferase NodH